MARDKATVTLDRDRVRNAMALTCERSMSDVIELALDRLIHAERLRRDLVAYGRTPPTPDELALVGLPMRLDLGDDDVDSRRALRPRPLKPPLVRRGDVWFADVRVTSDARS